MSLGSLEVVTNEWDAFVVAAACNDLRPLCQRIGARLCFVFV